MSLKIIDTERAEYFDQMADKWDALGPSPDEDVIMDFLRKLPIDSKDVVMDVGTGTGLLIPYIMRFNPITVIAVDISAQMLGKVKEKYSQYGTRLQTLNSDVHALTVPDRSVDVAICNGVFPHFFNKPLALSELYRVLKTGGRLAINHFAGREFVNNIHSSIEHVLLKRDLLDEVEEVAEIVRQAGFEVNEAIDREAEYLLLAVKPEVRQ